MKKLILGLFAVGMIFTSCEKDEIDNQQAQIDALKRKDAQQDASNAANFASLQSAIDALAAASEAADQALSEALADGLAIAKDDLETASDALSAAIAAQGANLSAAIANLNAKVDAYVVQFTKLLIDKEIEFRALVAAGDAQNSEEIDEARTELLNNLGALTSVVAANAASAQSSITLLDETFNEALATVSSTLIAAIESAIDNSVTGVSVSDNKLVITITKGDGTSTTIGLDHLNEYVRDFAYDAETNILSWKFFYANGQHEPYSIDLSELQNQINDNAEAISKLREDLAAAVTKLETADSTNIATIRGEITGHIVSLTAQASQVLADNVSEINGALTALQSSFTTQISALSTSTQAAIQAQATALTNAITTLNTAIASGDSATAMAAASALATEVTKLNTAITNISLTPGADGADGADGQDGADGAGWSRRC